MEWVDKPQNYKDLYGILQLLQGSHLKNFPLKALKLGWVAFHSVASRKWPITGHQVTNSCRELNCTFFQLVQNGI